MRHEEFTVVYDGWALEGHTMDVRDLAPALLSFGRIFDEASRLLYGDKVEVKLHVRAVEAGCFSIDLAIVQSLANQVRDMLNGEWLSAALKLKELIITGSIVGSWSLIKLIKVLKGRTPSVIKDLPNGMVRIQHNGETFDIPVALLKIYQDIAIRTAVQTVISPLFQEGIGTITFKEKGERVDAISKEEANYFAVPKIGPEEILREKRKAVFSIVSLAFKEENKWRLYDGSNTIHATIADKEFLSRVERDQISFRRSDVLICEVEDISTRDENGLKTEHIVTKVLEHKPGIRQIPLFTSGTDTD